MSELAKIIAKIIRNYLGSVDIDKVAMEIAEATRAYNRRAPAPEQLCEGLQPVDPALLEDFKQTMQNETIPSIIEAVRMRQKAAAEYGLPKPQAQAEPVATILKPFSNVILNWLINPNTLSVGAKLYTHPIPAAPAVPDIDEEALKLMQKIWLIGNRLTGSETQRKAEIQIVISDYLRSKFAASPEQQGGA